jgi:hypothetical protein
MESTEILWQELRQLQLDLQHLLSVNNNEGIRFAAASFLSAE